MDYAKVKWICKLAELVGHYDRAPRDQDGTVSEISKRTGIPEDQVKEVLCKT